MSEPRVLRPGEVLPPLDLQSDPLAPALAEPKESVAMPARRSAGRVALPAQRSGTARQRPDSHSKTRFQTINDFVDNTMQTLEFRASLAWFTLWRNTKPTGLARIAVSDLARRMGCSPATAKRALKDLKRAGLLTVVARGSDGRGVSTYRLTTSECLAGH